MRGIVLTHVIKCAPSILRMSSTGRPLGRTSVTVFFSKSLFTQWTGVTVVSEPVYEIAGVEAVDEAVKVHEAAFYEWDGAKDLEKSAASWKQTLTEKPGALLTVARLDGRIVTYVLGYDAQEAGVFFIALMGGLPEIRGKGIGRGLFRFTLDEILRRGYRAVDINTLNRYRGMLALCIAEDFDIVDLRFDQGRSCNRIYLRRVFGPHVRP